MMGGVVTEWQRDDALAVCRASVTARTAVD